MVPHELAIQQIYLACNESFLVFLWQINSCTVSKPVNPRPQPSLNVLLLPFCCYPRGKGMVSAQKDNRAQETT